MLTALMLAEMELKDLAQAVKDAELRLRLTKVAADIWGARTEMEVAPPHSPSTDHADA